MHIIKIMIKVSLKFLIFAITVHGHINASQSCTINGSYKGLNETYTNLTINGSANLSKFNVNTLKVHGGAYLNNVYSQGLIHVNGFLNGANVESQTIKIEGPGIVDGLTIGQNASINGPLTGQNIRVSAKCEVNGRMAVNKSNFDNIKINGSLESNSIQVNGIADINGNINAELSKFYNIIKASSRNVTLSECQAKNIEIRPIKENNHYVDQIMTLKDGTVIDGSVEFESNKGTVHMYGNALITGSVKGAKVVYHGSGRVQGEIIAPSENPEDEISEEGQEESLFSFIEKQIKRACLIAIVLACFWN